MKFQPSKSILGYTLVEFLVIVVVIGIMSAIAAPSWLSLLNRLRLNAAQAEALSVIREAQASAKREKRNWEASFRKNNQRVQWSVHPESESQDNWKWNDLIGENAERIDIDESYSTFEKRNGAYHAGFQHKGWAIPQLGRITFISRGATNSKKALRRCVFVSTYLGAMRTDSDRGCQD